MHVEVWTDVVCPWCYIGKRRLEQALADAGVDARITHRAFQLDPSAVSNGERTVEHLAHKYGVSPAEAEAMMANVAQVAAGVGLAEALPRKAGELSHGQKQWLEIGMLLAQEPRLLLVDEPAAGMTLAEREHTTRLLVDLARTRAVVVVEHDMDFVRRLNCKVTVLHEGAVLAEGTLDHVTKNLQVIDVYLGR